MTTASRPGRSCSTWRVGCGGTRTAWSFRCGRLAYKWFPGEEPDWVVERFSALIRLAWQRLFACSHPHVADMEGRLVRRARIGSHAKAWLRADPNRWLGDWVPYGMYKLLPGRR